MDSRKVILLLGLTPLCVLAQAPDVKSGVGHLQKLDSMFLQDESVVVKKGSDVASTQAATEKKKVLSIPKKSVRKQSVKPKAVALASSGRTLRDENGAVNRVHNGLDDVTAADLAASKTLQPSLPKSPWEEEVREIASYNANRPPLPEGRSNPSISALSAEFGDRVPAAPRRTVKPRRNYDLSRKMTVFSRKDSFNVATQAPSQNEINEKRLLETAPRRGSARIPDVSGLVRN